eukprot:s1016_g4.t1
MIIDAKNAILVYRLSFTSRAMGGACAESQLPALMECYGMHASEEFPEEHGDENDLLTRFETLSRNFRSEVQTLFGQEKETAKDLNRLQQRNAELEKQLQLEREEAQGIGAAIQRFFANQAD